MPSAAAPGKVQPAPTSAHGSAISSSKASTSSPNRSTVTSSSTHHAKATSSIKAVSKPGVVSTAAKPFNATPAAPSKAAVPHATAAAPTAVVAPNTKGAAEESAACSMVQHIAAGRLADALQLLQGSMQEDVNAVVADGPCAGLTPLLMIVPGNDQVSSSTPGASALITLLLAKGASPDAQLPGSGDTPVMWAITNQQQELALQLVTQAKKLNVKNTAGHTALDLAMSSGQEAIAAAIISVMGADIAQVNEGALLRTALERKSDVILTELVKVLRSTQLEAAGVTFKLLAAQGFGVAALAHWSKFSRMQGDKPVDGQGNTALHMLAESGAPYNLVMGLIKLGLGPNTTNEAANTPLHVAALAGHLEVCRALVDGGADVLKRNGKNRRPREMPKCPDCTKEYLLEAEEAAKNQKANKQSELWDEKIKATQTESAFGVRCL